MSFRLRSRVRTIAVFFSSRRRHTRFDCDWSSDVCSSDLAPTAGGFCQRAADAGRGGELILRAVALEDLTDLEQGHVGKAAVGVLLRGGDERSEERRVGEESRSRWAPDHSKKKNSSVTHAY